MSTHGILEPYLREYLTLGTQLAEFTVWALVVYLLGRLVVGPLVGRVVGRTRLNRTVREAIGKIVHGLVIVVAVSIGAGVAGFQTALTGSALVVGVVSLAIGFAAQEVLANFVSGVFIVQDRRLNVGDFVEWEGVSGTIADIGFRVTTIKTANNETVLVPNSEFATKPVTNLTHNDPQAVSYEFGIGYADDIDTATDLLREIAAEMDVVLEDPAPAVRVSGLGDSAVLLSTRLWLAKADRDQRSRVKATYIQRVTEACDDAGIDLSTTTQHAVTGEVALADTPDDASVAD